MHVLSEAAGRLALALVVGGQADLSLSISLSLVRPEMPPEMLPESVRL